MIILCDMVRLPAILLLLFLVAAGTLAAQSPADSLDPDEILVDATFVPCSDSTESLLILQDGRAVYALGDRGASFSIAGPLLTDLRGVIETAESVVNPKGMDSCSTLGVILDGPRFLLINRKNPTPETRELYIRLERLRKFALKKMTGAIDKYNDQIEQEADSTIVVFPSVAPGEIRRRIRISPIARQWGCNGSVVIAALVTYQGKVRQAVVRRVKVKGKCTALLSVTALRAVLLSTFAPAKKTNGKTIGAWMEVEVPFARMKRPK
ncbi:MAG: hypothetical protein JWQ98_552 [Chlorobi bacterium]|nr:hypothetical protein [Chlorobiota bacterium]